MKTTLVLIAVFASVLALPGSYQIRTHKDEFGIPALNKNVLADLLNKKPSWEFEISPFFKNMSLAEVKHLLGFKRNPITRSKPFPMVSNIRSDLPDNYNAGQAYPQCKSIGTIQNQASCGSCWAFGCVEAITDRFCISSKGSVTTQLSFSDEVCCGPDDGCFGGDAMDAWSYAQQSGLVTAACYPYTIPTCPPSEQPCTNFVNTPECANQCVDGESWSASKHYLSNAYGVSSDESAIRSEIYQNGPVEACFDVYEDFLSYKTGVYQHVSGGYLGGHCVKIVGWGVQGGTPYWLINNSWTTYWGDKGTFKILRGSDECGIEDDVVAGTPQLN